MLRLYSERPALAKEAHLDLARLRAPADAGDPIAEFHEGLTLALGRSMPRDRSAGVSWLRCAAESQYAPAMLALGMALSGPGSLEDDAIVEGIPPRSDEVTDLVQACLWLESAAASDDQRVAALAQGELDFRKLKQRMTREQHSECRHLLRARRPR